MDSDRLVFDSPPPPRHAHMLFLGGSSNPIFQETRSMLGVEETTKKRLPLFTSSEEVLAEEYYCDELIRGKKRRLTPQQVHVLESSFEAEGKLEADRKTELAKQLGLKPKQVAVWFQNRRARWKTKQLELNLDRLNAAYNSLVAEHNSILKDNDHLRSQVAILTEMLQAKELTAAPTVRANINQARAEEHRCSAVDGGESCFHESLHRESFFQESFEEDAGDDGCCIPTGGTLGENPYSNDWWGATWN